MRQVARGSAQHKKVIALEGFNTTLDEHIRTEFGITRMGGTSGDPLRKLAQQKLLMLNGILKLNGFDLDLSAIGGIILPNHATARLAIGEQVKTVQFLSGIFELSKLSCCVSSPIPFGEEQRHECFFLMKT